MRMCTSELPAGMLRNGRPVDPVFDPDEELYRRCVADDLHDGRLFPDRIAFYPDWSVNRSKYSEPEWVLLPCYQDCGVIALQVRDVPARLASDGGVEYNFRVEHVPLEENYAHSEVRTYRDGIHLTQPKPPDLPKSAKRKFRDAIWRRAAVVRPPKT